MTPPLWTTMPFGLITMTPPFARSVPWIALGLPALTRFSATEVFPGCRKVVTSPGAMSNFCQLITAFFVP